MKKCIPFFAVLLLCLGTRAQDTVVVQTLTWDQSRRDGVFSFPGDAPQSWEKILMMYNMRCHDAAVGNGNVGCREWDYSCNTFITDSTRLDSTRSTHPSHLIFGYDLQNGPTFTYLESPVHTYYQFNQTDVEYTSSTSEFFAKVGADHVNYPIGQNAPAGKAQYLYRANELSAAGLSAGKITGLKLSVFQVGNPLNFLKIKLKQTSKTFLDPDDPDLDGFSEVYFLNTEFDPTGEHFFKFHTDFNWNGVSNLIVEFSFSSTSLARPTSVKAHNPGFQADLVATADHALQFKGSGAVVLPKGRLSSISNEITVSMWVNGDAARLPRDNSLFEGTDAVNRRQANVHLPWSNERIYWDCGADDGGYDRIDKLASPAEYKGQWHHWAFTKNAVTGEMKIYLDGALWHIGTGKTKPIDLNSFIIGANAVGGNLYFGLIDEFQVWNKELDETTIRAWMNRPLTSAHPNYGSLVAHFGFDEGAGTIVADSSPNGIDGRLVGSPSWFYRRGESIEKNFKGLGLRLSLTFVRGNYTLNETPLLAVDSIENSPNMVVRYAVIDNRLEVLDTQYVWDALGAFVYDENGLLLDFLDLPPDGEITVTQLEYYTFQPAKFEILSLVTPYGNGLDLGAAGKTFTIDVTDYAPILRGDKRMSIELGGENQEELDIRFLFIRGTPVRPVLEVQNIWPFRRAWFGQILNNEFFEPRMVPLDPAGKMYKLRAAITGHEQNGEFEKRNHYLNIGGGSRDFNFDVWKECSTIPIYPQGGTWLFDRAGWCPGDPTEVFQFDITDRVQAGSTVEIDYGLNGVLLDQANYLVSAQLVTYGEPSFSVDAAVVAIIRPTDQLEFARFNPACNNPSVSIQNTGATTLTSLDIEYGERGGIKHTHRWTGNLRFLETAEVTLPLDYLSFWKVTTDPGIFEVQISNPNGTADAYPRNNFAYTAFSRPAVFDFPLEFELRTNTRPEETSYRIRDMSGNIILDRSGLAANTTYKDRLQLGRGCYTLELLDSGDDGLYYWFYATRGRGVAKFNRVLPNGSGITARSFEAEFGRYVYFDFVVPLSNATADPETIRFISLSPNPATDRIQLEIQGFQKETLDITVTDLQGKIVLHKKQETQMTLQSIPINTHMLAPGMYIVKIQSGDQFITETFVKQ